MLLPFTGTLAGESSAETSKPPTAQAPGKQSGSILTISGRLIRVKIRSAARLRVNTNKRQELVAIWLHDVDAGIHKQCRGRYYLDTIYDRYAKETRIKYNEFQKLTGTWITLSTIKVINQGEKHAACMFNSLKIISTPK